LHWEANGERINHTEKTLLQESVAKSIILLM